MDNIHTMIAEEMLDNMVNEIVEDDIADIMSILADQDSDEEILEKNINKDELEEDE